MSNIQTVHAVLTQWFQDLVRVDKLDADNPTKLFAAGSTTALPLPANTLTVYPVKDLQFVRDTLNSITGRGLFTFGLAYRFHKRLTVDELPIVKVEAVAQYLMVQSLLSLGGCDGIRNALPSPEEYPVMISRDGTDQDDWLIHVHLVLEVEFAVTDFGLSPEYGNLPDDAEVELNQLTVGVYRDESDSLGIPPYNLDNEIIITRITP